jgi:WD40 repeat protein
MVNSDNSLQGRSPALQRAYFGKYPYNLICSGNLQKYYQLLCNFNFLLGKIQHPEFGVQALIEDYNLLDELELEGYSDSNPEAVNALRLIQGALRLSAHVLVKDPTQLTSQLLGRLQNFDISELQSLLQQAKQNLAVGLRPLNSSLIFPTSSLLRTMVGHSCSITAIAITPNNQQIVSVSKDGILKVWNLATGQEVFTLITLHNNHYTINALAITLDGKQVISGSENGTIAIWDLIKRQKVLTLAEGGCPVRVLAATSDREWLIKRQKVLTLAEGGCPVRVLAITSDGKWLISGHSYEVKRWNLETRESEILMSLQGSELMKTYNFLEYVKRDALVTSTTLSSDGTRAIFCVRIHGHYTSGTHAHLLDENIILIKNLETAEEYEIVRSIEHNYITAVSISLDKKQAIYGWQDGHLEFWNLETRELLFAIREHCDEIVAVTIASDGKQAVSSSKDKTLKIWDLKIGEEISTLTDSNDLVYAIAIAPNCQQAISASGDALLKIWSLKNSHDLKDFHVSSIVRHRRENSVNINSNGTFLLISTVLINFVFLYSCSLFFSLEVPTFWIIVISIYSICLSVYAGVDIDQLRRYLKFFSFLWLIPVTLIFKIVEKNKVITDEDSTRKIYLNNLQQFIEEHSCYTSKTSSLQHLEYKNHFEQLINSKLHTDMITSLTATTDSKWVISGSNDKTIKIWDLTTGKHLSTLIGHQNGINSVAVSSNNTYLISGSFDKTLKLWDLKNLNKVHYLRSLAGIIYDVLLISIYAILTILEVLIIINFNFFHPSLLSLLLLLLLSCPYYLVIGLVNKADFDWGSTIVVTPDNKKVIAGSRDKTIKLWDIRTRKQLFTLKGHTDWITSVAVTLDSKYLISGSKDETLKFWNLENRKELFTLTGHSSEINAVAIMPDGSKAISGSSDGQLKIWDLETRQAIVTINGHRKAVQAITLNEDSKYFVSAASDHMLKVWDLLTGQEITSFTADSPLTSCVFTSDGKIITGDQTGQLHFLRLENVSALS